MHDKLNKQARAKLFRTRLGSALQDSGTSQSALARAIGIDRSTISQALGTEAPRLPGAHVVASAARVLGVSADWLLGLSDRPESAEALSAAALSLTEAPRALIDTRIFEWHQEAAGYKIRHVPAALPDMLKTDAFLTWEYEPHLGRTTAQAIHATRERLAWMRETSSDYEIALPLHELQAFASATGYYAGLPAHIRLAQLDHLYQLTEQLYPRMRLYLYDARKVFSAPITIFGPLLAVLYAGGHYIGFRDRDRIETLTAHFDTLIRQAALTARDIPEHITILRNRL